MSDFHIFLQSCSTGSKDRFALWAYSMATISAANLGSTLCLKSGLENSWSVKFY